MTHLYDPPLRRPGVQVSKDRVRIECARRRTPSAPTAGCRSASAAPSAASSSTAAAACIERVVGIGKPVQRIGIQMVLVHLGARLCTFGGSLKQIPVNLVRRRVRRWSVIERDFDHFGAGCRWGRRIVGGIHGLVVVGVDFHPKSGLRTANLIRKQCALQNIHDRSTRSEDRLLAFDREMHFSGNHHEKSVCIGM